VEAMVLAAGAGTRLRPLTLLRPKPLFPLLNRPLLAWIIDILARFQVRRLILNSHHLSEQVDAFLTQSGSRDRFDDLQLLHEPMILGTGGGIKNTETFWRSDPFLVLNGDSITNIDLFRAIEFHRRHQGPVTLVLHDYPSFNNIVADERGRIQELRVPSGGQWAFTGIHILNREIFGHLPAVDFYDIVPVYQDLILRGVPIWAYRAQGHYWRDMGTPQSYRLLHQEFLSGNALALFDPGREYETPSPGWCLHPRARIEEGVRLEGWGAVGADCLLAKGCSLRNTILWDRVRVREGVRIDGAIVSEGRDVPNDLLGDIV
jgi:mannose-1-phosphate guanylyltransferase